MPKFSIDDLVLTQTNDRYNEHVGSVLQIEGSLENPTYIVKLLNNDNRIIRRKYLVIGFCESELVKLPIDETE